MVARPSLKRVVPGSVPPWRVLCAESARALKAFFSVLCVSKSVLLLESKFGQILRALNLRAFWVRPLCPRVDAGAAGPSFCGLAVARPRVVPGSFPLRARVFRGPVVVSGCRNVLRGRAVVFHFRQSRRRGSLSSSLRLIRSLRAFAVETLLALRTQNFQAGGALQLNANSKSSPSRWGCMMKRFSADVVSCAQKLAATLCPCNVLLAACQFVLFAARRFLQFVTYFVGRAAR